jgi:hypothetical protein
MFYFTGDVVISFQLKDGDQIVIADSISIDVLYNNEVISTHTPILVNDVYQFMIHFDDTDIQPYLYRVYSFIIRAIEDTRSLVANGSFLVHMSQYDNMDPTEVYLSNEDSEIYMQCADQTREQCLTSPPVKPSVLSVELFKMTDATCDCTNKK